MTEITILIVEDDDFQYEIYEDTLSEYRLMRATSGTAALAMIKNHPPGLIILDHILADAELGMDYLPEFKEVLPHVPIIIISGALEVQQQIYALQGPRRAHYCINKPVDVDELLKTVRTALKECGELEVVRQFEALERSRRIDADILLSRSTDRLMRQNELLPLIKDTHERPNISALARRFRVARRTILRDIEELIRRNQLPPESLPKWTPETDETDN